MKSRQRKKDWKNEETVLWEDLLEGATLAALNAKRLVDDGRLLHNSKSFPSAFDLSRLAFQEMIKSMFFLDKYRKREDITNTCDVFTKHAWKMAAYPQPPPFLSLSGRHPDSIDDKRWQELRKAGQERENDRQKSIYVGFSGGRWVSPQNEDLAIRWPGGSIAMLLNTEAMLERIFSHIANLAQKT